MNGDLLVYLILVPFYMIGFAIVGIIGHRERYKEPGINEFDKSMRMLSMSRGSSGQVETESTSPMVEIESPTLHDDSTIKSFRTDTLYLDTIESCPKVKEILKNIAGIMKIYSIPLLNVMDYVSDISTAFFFLSQTNTRHLGIYSLLVIFAQRMISAIILGEHYGWLTGVRQIFDLQVFHAVYVSIKRERVVLQVIQIKILEGFLESFPQLLFQSYYLVKPSKHAEETAIVHVSMILSLLSLSKAWMFSDEVAVPRDGFSCCRHAEILETSDTHRERKHAYDTANWGRLSWPIRITVILVWRFGEVVVTVSIIVGAANVISARGTVIGCFFLLLSAFYIQSLYPQTKKSSWFHYAIQKNRLQLAMEKKWGRSAEDVDCSSEPKAETTNNNMLAYGKILGLYSILTVLYFAELNYFFWALPTFRPRKFVIVYYIWKVTLLIVMLTACMVSEGSYSLFMIFDTLLYYFVFGLFCFPLGGIIASLIAIDTEQYAKAIEADPFFLLQMINKQEYIFIERVMRSGVCSAHRLIEDAISWMFENNINPNDEDAIGNFAEKQPYCKLLYYLIKYQFVETGSSLKKRLKVNVEDPKVYRNYAVPALVYKCNSGRKKTLRSQLARTILSKLVTKRRFSGGWRTISSYEAIMKAGASLHFVKYHLDAPDICFQKAGRFKCTAQQLHDDGFNLLFCLRANFTPDELILAGFDVSLLNNKLVLERSDNGEGFDEYEHLKRLKDSGFNQFFNLNYTREDLLSTNLFSPHDILEYDNAFRNSSKSIRFSFTSNDLPLRRSKEGCNI